MARKRKKHSIGSSWTAMRKIRRKKRRVRITKVGRKRYKIRVLTKKHRTTHRRRHRKRR